MKIIDNYFTASRNFHVKKMLFFVKIKAMKKVILISGIFINSFVFSQKIDSVGVIKTSELTKEFFDSHKQNTKVGSVDFEDGNVLKLNDEVIIGYPSGIDSKTSSMGGSTFAAYDNIILGTPAGAILKGFRKADTNEILEKKIKIVKIRATSSMGNRKIFAELKPIGFNLVTDSKITVLDLIIAIRRGEVINPNSVLTKDQALKILEEQKKLLDLGLISQDAFDKKREELKPIILK